MRQNRVKSVMKQGQLALGTYVTFADPQIVAGWLRCRFHRYGAHHL